MDNFKKYLQELKGILPELGLIELLKVELSVQKEINRRKELCKK